MKVLIIKKKQILIFSFFIILIISTLILLRIPKNETDINVIAPIDYGKATSIDLNGDNIEDTIEIISNDGFDDIKITIGNKNYFLSKLCENNQLGKTKPYWPTKVFIKNLSRSSTPEIIVQASQDKSISYVFKWIDGDFKKVFTSNKNIFGILDSNGNKTPQCYSLNSSSGNSSLDSFMIIDNATINITKDSIKIPDLGNILSLIDLLQKYYELDEVPDIFTENISESELGLLWNLDKEHNQYSFQNAFFYDESIDNEGNITSMKWTLSFEKYIREKDDSSKTETTFYVNTIKSGDNSYKISSIYKK